MKVILFFLLIVLLNFNATAFAKPDLVSNKASSAYVLPYPSFMPGTMLYRPHLLFEVISKYWYFGNFSQFKYHLKESDKYLVESKTLFEYSQYLYAYKSLKKSDEFFEKTLPYLVNAGKEGKDTRQNRKILSQAAQKHIEVLQKLSNEMPDKFLWKPEKEKPTLINIRDNIENSISIRSKYL